MRMLVLSIVAFVLVGLALGISKLGIVERVPQLIAGLDPSLTFEVTPPADDQAPFVSLFRTRPEGVLLLTTANRAQTARFQLPQDVPLTSGALALKATAQIADDQHSLLRVLVGNQIRGEVLLRPGQYDINTEIELTADDLASDTLGVRFALLVTDDDGACTPESDWSNVIEIEQDTRVMLHVADTDLTPRDQVAAWGNVALIGWPNWLEEDERHARWISASKLAARGYNVRFVDAPNSETLTGRNLEALVASQSPAFAAEETAFAWPEFIAEAGSNAGHRTFKQSTTWRHWYRVGPGAHLSAPGQFDYELMLGPLPNGADWTVVVTHNGTILDVSEVSSRGGVHSGRVDLTGVEVLSSNSIEVTATSDYETVGICNNGPDLFAELRPNSRLLGGGETFEDNLADVSGMLNQRQPISVKFPDQMSLVEAQRTLDLASDLIYPGAELHVVKENAILTAVRRTEVARIPDSFVPSTMVVGRDENGRTVVARPADLADGSHDLAGGAIVLAISPIIEDRLSMAPRQ